MGRWANPENDSNNKILFYYFFLMLLGWSTNVKVGKDSAKGGISVVIASESRTRRLIISVDGVYVHKSLIFIV